MDYGRDYNYANSRLRGTIIKYQGNPYILEEVDSRGFCHLYELLNDDNEVRVKLDEVDLRPPKLGFVNYKGRISYISRRPSRSYWKQGLQKGSLKSYYSLNVSDSDLKLCILGRFDNKRDGDNFCINRDWAVIRGKIYYKNLGVVGNYKRGNFELKEDYSYLNPKLRGIL